MKDGDQAFDQKDYKTAYLEYAEASRLYPQKPNLYLKQGQSLLKLKQKEEAYKVFQKAVALQPGLLQSKSFKKQYKKLQKKYGASAAKTSKTS